MVATTHTATLIGVDARLVEVEIELSQGIPFFSIIGLGDRAVQEAKYRIQSALRASDLELPHKKVTINLAPAELRKDGAALDLPMALGLLVGAGLLDARALEGSLAIGELALTGHLRPVRGALAVAALASAQGYRRVLVPSDNGPEAAALTGLEVVAAPTLSAMVDHLAGRASLPPPRPAPPRVAPDQPDLADVRGQALARRALEIAAVGGHNLLLIGPPGTGKTMLARRLPSILPPLTPTEQVEVTRVWSAAGLTLAGSGLVCTRPFRAPHHTISGPGLVGGGNPLRPGEVSLAHRGVLFLDEMPELPRRVLDALRQPLEDRDVVLSRARETVRLPADVMLVGAANPCPCGWLGHGSGRCRCQSEEIARYAGRISGPLLDRMDLVVEVGAVGTDALLGAATGEPSRDVRARVVDARARAAGRGDVPNARLAGRALRARTALDDEARKLLEEAAEVWALSARSVDRVRRVSRSLADLEGTERIAAPHVAEALRYRPPSTWQQAGGAPGPARLRVAGP